MVVGHITVVYKRTKLMTNLYNVVFDLSNTCLRSIQTSKIKRIRVAYHSVYYRGTERSENFTTRLQCKRSFCWQPSCEKRFVSKFNDRTMYPYTYNKCASRSNRFIPISDRYYNLPQTDLLKKKKS